MTHTEARLASLADELLLVRDDIRRQHERHAAERRPLQERLAELEAERRRLLAVAESGNDD